MELKNLNVLKNETETKYHNSFSFSDRRLPQRFKELITQFDNDRVTYNEYSFEVQRSSEGLIVAPNQWLYIAAFYSSYCRAMIAYKQELVDHLLKEFSSKKSLEEPIRECQNNENNAYSLLKNYPEGTNKEYLVKFLSDYSWWGGAKTIDRSDFCASAILSSTRLVNATHGYVAEICEFLAKNPEAENILLTSPEIQNKNTGSEPKLIVSEKKLTSFVLSTISYFNTIDELHSIIPFTSSTSPIKVSKIDSFSLTGMFLESTIDDVKERNTDHIRWFEDLFKLGERNVFLSTQWNSQGNYQLTLDDFIKMIQTCYGEKYVYKTGSNGEHQLYLTQAITIRGKESNNLQQIYYGAPGTGKSFEINRLTEGKEVIRTTFHPDSDYSTFVGAYKPTSIEIPVRDVTGKVIIEGGKQVTENRIVYEFVEQAFLQAYTNAWNAYATAAEGELPKEQYLVIEEINRGNCAQIFGDLFQLLDRNRYGFSDYPITADKDMKKQLAKAFKDLTIAEADRINNIYKKDIVSQVLNGDVLLLPDNLYIWATMNTSDQSLFPIDSAFKRRWDWKYMPICEGKENGVSLGWQIKTNGKTYDWWQFVEKINSEINEQTKSEDKKLGYFFCKAEDGIITAETFVGKVVFYLWNDVFKDQAFASDIFQDGDEELTFSKFYDVDANGKAVVREDKVELFLENLKVEPISASSIEAEAATV